MFPQQIFESINADVQSMPAATGFSQTLESVFNDREASSTEWAALFENFYSRVLAAASPEKVSTEVGASLFRSYGKSIRILLRDFAVESRSEEASHGALTILAAMRDANCLGTLGFVAKNSTFSGVKQAAAYMCNDLISSGSVGSPIGVFGGPGKAFASVASVYSIAGEFGPGQTEGIFALLAQRDAGQLVKIQHQMHLDGS